jgi:hypothetical protein
MSGGLEQAILRLQLAERQLAQFDAYRNPNDPQHDRKLRKLQQDRDRAESDLAWVERMANG